MPTERALAQLSFLKPACAHPSNLATPGHNPATPALAEILQSGHREQLALRSLMSGYRVQLHIPVISAQGTERIDIA